MKLTISPAIGKCNNILYYNIGPFGLYNTFESVCDNEYIGIDLNRAKEYATLFAAAPEMLEMLKGIVKNPAIDESRFDAIHTLIEKATTI